MVVVGARRELARPIIARSFYRDLEINKIPFTTIIDMGNVKRPLEVADKRDHQDITPVQYTFCNICTCTAIFHACKNDNFQMKNWDIFLLLMRIHSQCFRAKKKNKKKNEYHCKPQFYDIKIGSKGLVTLHGPVCMMKRKRYHPMFSIFIKGQPGL